MGVAPAALSCSRVTGYGLFGNVVTVLTIPAFELPFPAPGLSLGMDVEEITSETEELLAGICFGTQGELGLDVEPGVETAALDNSTWPDGLNGL